MHETAPAADPRYPYLLYPAGSRFRQHDRDGNRAGAPRSPGHSSCGNRARVARPYRRRRPALPPGSGPSAASPDPCFDTSRPIGIAAAPVAEHRYRNACRYDTYGPSGIVTRARREGVSERGSGRLRAPHAAPPRPCTGWLLGLRATPVAPGLRSVTRACRRSLAGRSLTGDPGRDRDAPSQPVPPDHAVPSARGCALEQDRGDARDPLRGRAVRGRSRCCTGLRPARGRELRPGARGGDFARGAPSLSICACSSTCT